MPVAVAIGVAGVATAYSSYQAGKKVAGATEQAARTEAEAAERALEFSKEQYADIKPYLMRSMEGYQELLEDPEAYKETPGYMFRLQEGLKALGIPEGARNISGAQMKSAIRYGQDYATAEYQNALGRIAGLGQLAQGVGGVSGQYAARAGGYITQAGRARAQGITGAASARASGLMGVGSAIGQMAGMGLGYYGMQGGGGGGGIPTEYYPPVGSY